MVRLLLIVLLISSCNQKPVKLDTKFLADEQAFALGKVKSTALTMSSSKKCEYLVAYTRDSVVVRDSAAAYFERYSTTTIILLWLFMITPQIQ